MWVTILSKSIISMLSIYTWFQLGTTWTRLTWSLWSTLDMNDKPWHGSNNDGKITARPSIIQKMMHNQMVIHMSIIKRCFSLAWNTSLTWLISVCRTLLNWMCHRVNKMHCFNSFTFNNILTLVFTVVDEYCYCRKLLHQTKRRTCFSYTYPNQKSELLIVSSKHCD